jgi:hypothetical protein
MPEQLIARHVRVRARAGKMAEAGESEDSGVLKILKFFDFGPPKTQYTPELRATGTYLERGLFGPIAKFVKPIGLLWYQHPSHVVSGYLATHFPEHTFSGPCPVNFAGVSEVIPR